MRNMFRSKMVTTVSIGLGLASLGLGLGCISDSVFLPTVDVAHCASIRNKETTDCEFV